MLSVQIVVGVPQTNRQYSPAKAGEQGHDVSKQSGQPAAATLSSILATKLYVPPPRPNTVVRPRLIERLNEGLLRKLTLVSAPAGFGKTTVVSEWLASCNCTAAWLSLDEGDSDPFRFLTYVVASLQTVAPVVGTTVLHHLQSPQPPPAEVILTALLNDLVPIPDHVTLVLDDYHLVEARQVDDIVTFLIEHLPPQLHLVITTREDPALPLARLRARGQLTEVRVRDLRFNASEAAEFFNYGMGLSLTSDDIAVLEQRTEGWIAGLQLAGLSLQGQQDIRGFIEAFAGDHRYVVDYLVEEVLERQPEPVRRFLLQTAILDQLSGSLCDAVSGQQDGKSRLESLERGNFFVVPLDDKRQWYRYHHLFAQVLHARLMEEQPDQIAALHGRASEWFEHHGLASDAIRHALAAKDFERAADLIEQAAPAMHRTRQEMTALGWLQALPVELFRVRPVLSLQYAGTLLSSGIREGVEDRLRDAERWLDTSGGIGERAEASAAGMVVVNEAEYRALPGMIAMYRSGLALAQGNLADTTKYARRVLDLAPDDDYLRRGGASALLGLVYWTCGDLEAAYQTYAVGMADLQRAGNISDVVGGSIALADIRIAQGKLRKALRIYDRGLQLAAQMGEPHMRGTADMRVGMREIYREYNDLDSASQQLLRSKEQGEHTGFPQNPYRWRVAMARLRQAEGDLDGAVELLQEAERLYVSDMHPNVRPIAALKTRVWLAQGRIGEAVDWAREQGMSVDDDLSYLREFEHITLARVLIAHYRQIPADRSILDTLGLLERLLRAAEAGGRTGRVVEILMLLALACQIQRDIPAALKSLERALTLAEPEGYVRLFVDEDAPMAALLERAAQQGIAPTYVRKLLSALGKGEAKAPVSQALTDPLSERELEVLRLFATDLNGPDIARELIVSLSTLRTHTQNIYTKLGVNSRRAAVRRADDLNLL